MRNSALMTPFNVIPEANRFYVQIESRSLISRECRNSAGATRPIYRRQYPVALRLHLYC